MNYFRWQSEAGRAWLGRKSAEIARRPSTMGVWYKERGERKRGERKKRGKKRIIETELEKKREKTKKGKRAMRKEVSEMRQQEKERRRKRERGSQAVVERCQPSVWSMRSSLEEASQAREGHTHTHTYVHTQIYTTIPKGNTFIESKNTIYTLV